MKILLVGSGAREHAIAAALLRTSKKPEIYCFGSSSNPGLMAICKEFYCGDITDVNVVMQKAKDWAIQLAFIGPEAPLEKGLADLLWQEAIPCIGPKQSLAKIESSKSFARELMQEYKVPGLPKFQYFKSMQGVKEYLEELGEGAYVVKADGLMGGKGVKVAGEHLQTIGEALFYCQEVLAKGHGFVIEEKLIGQEFSLMCFCDGETLAPMPLVQDHKRAFAGDKGPNTGGMGSYSDANHSLPFLLPKDFQQALFINQQVMEALQAKVGQRYVGILYGGFIATANGVYVIEFNARFGDPEVLNVLSLLLSDFTEICQAMVTGQLAQTDIRFASKASVCKYAVPRGYPDESIVGESIDLNGVRNKSALYLGSLESRDNKILTMGSRTAAYVGVADSLMIAEKLAEKEICAISGPLFHRDDIGTERVIQARIEQMRRLRAS